MTPRVALMTPAPTRTTSTSSLPSESTGPSATVRWFMAPPCGYTGATVAPRTAPSGREGWTGNDAYDLALVPTARRIWRLVERLPFPVVPVRRACRTEGASLTGSGTLSFTRYRPGPRRAHRRSSELRHPTIAKPRESRLV